VPDWLRPFGGDVLIVRDPDNGAYIAGVGIKRHDAFGQELSVGTEPAARGRGLARRLVAQAARRVLDDGAVPTYQHAASNLASARVADAAGFADRGWASFGLTDAAD
jgi:predicted GNAT family acetyltransferase